MFEELRAEMDRVMGKLPPRCKEVFYMSRIEGLNTREIAERTGTSTQNVEKHIARALNNFSRHFSGCLQGKLYPDVLLFGRKWISSVLKYGTPPERGGDLSEPPAA